MTDVFVDLKLMMDKQNLNLDFYLILSKILYNYSNSEFGLTAFTLFIYKI